MGGSPAPPRNEHPTGDRADVPMGESIETPSETRGETPTETPNETDVRRVDAPGAGLTPRQRVAMVLWRALGRPVFRLTFHNWYGIRRSMLRLFGADVHPTVRIRPTARISHPWNLSIGAHTAVGDHAILFSLGRISIGRRCTISQYAHLCAGGHDYTRRDMPLITDPIEIGDDVWVAADVFIGAGVTVGEDTVIGARSSVLGSLPARSICAGDDARRTGPRIIRYPPPAAPATPAAPAAPEAP